jgi:hypothetical protein
MLGFSSKYEKFWKWFQKHEDKIFHFDRNQGSVFKELASQLGRVHSELVFEFSGIKEGRREFTVSAGGIRSAFPEVTELVREAPNLPRWHIIAFRQRQDAPTIKCGDKALEREAVFFDYASAGDKIDITVFVPGLGNGSADDMIGLKTIGYLLLDAAIGEYDVETKLAGIEFVDASAFPGRRRRPLQELPPVVDTLSKGVQ